MAKQKKPSKKQRIIVAVCAAALVLAVALALVLIFINRADNIISITFDVDGTEVEYLVPFSEYKAIYLYYKSQIPSLMQSDDGIYVFTDEEKNNALKAQTKEKLIEYYSLVCIADGMGIGITEEDKADFSEQYRKLALNYASENGIDEKKAMELYEKSLEEAGMTLDYFEMNFYRSLLNFRIKAALGRGIEEIKNAEYLAYEQIYVSYTKGDSASAAEASDKIRAALSELDGGADFYAVAEKYSDTQADAVTYFNASNYRAVNMSYYVGATTAEMVKSLECGEYSGVMSGDENDDAYAFYMIIRRVKITEDFICSDLPTASDMYEHPYYGASEYSPAYEEYLTLLKAYEQNGKVVYIDMKRYDEISFNSIK